MLRPLAIGGELIGAPGGVALGAVTGSNLLGGAAIGGVAGAATNASTSPRQIDLNRR